jgi:hypothetical protein
MLVSNMWASDCKTRVISSTCGLSRQLNQCLSSTSVRRVGSQEQILGCERASGAQAETHKVDKIGQDP